MSTLSNVAAIASALAPLMQNLMASKGRASSGRKGPSATKATIPAIRQGRSSRRGRRKRGRRGRGARKGPVSGPDFRTGFDRKMSSSTAVAGRDFKTYFKQSGTPMHKEWGEGIRYVGCSVLGQMQVPAAGSFWSFNPTSAQSANNSPNPGDVTYYDLYAAVSGGNLERIIYALHPYNITRLQYECNNWGRYCFRSITIHSEAKDSTSQTNGYVTALTHDVSWALALDQTDGVSAYDMAELGNHASGPFYRSFKIQSADFRGDRVWPTALPILVVESGSTTSPTSGFLSSWVEDYYQFAYGNVMEGASDGVLAGAKGFVYITYEIDFYSVKSDGFFGSQMQPINWNDGVVGTTISRPLTSLKRLVSSQKELSSDTEKDSKEKEVLKEPSPLSKPPSARLSRVGFPPRSLRHRECLEKTKEQT